MKVLPVKFPDELYEDLRLAATREGTSMAQLIRRHITGPIKKIAQRAQMKKSGLKYHTLVEFLEYYSYQGSIYKADKTDDEILYGGKLGCW